MSPVASYIVQSLVTLLAIVALAVLVLYGGRRLGLGRPSGPLDLVGRLPLDTRRAVYLVRVGKLIYVVGASEGGLTKLGEIDGDALPPSASSGTGSSFAEVLGRLMKSERLPGEGGPPAGGGASHGIGGNHA